MENKIGFEMKMYFNLKQNYGLFGKIVYFKH